MKMLKRKTMMLIMAAAVIIMAAFAGCGAGGGEAGATGQKASWPAMDSLRAIDAADITEIGYTRATEGGLLSGVAADDPTVIEDIYLRLCNVNIKESTEAAVDDNGLSIKVSSGGTSLKFEFEGDILVLEDGSRYEVDNLDSLRSYIDGMIADDQGGEPEPGGSSTSGTDTSGSFNILEGMQIQKDGSAMYLYGNDFLLTMPDNDKWDIDQYADDAFTIYLKAARDSGYDGELVSIKAFDMDDTSYEQAPHYQVAGVGRNVNKRFVAFYPTDVRWDGTVQQQTDDYRELSDYLGKIGEGAVNSPFQTADSD